MTTELQNLSTFSDSGFGDPLDFDMNEDGFEEPSYEMNGFNEAFHGDLGNFFLN